jgi:hypothetical protein
LSPYSVHCCKHIPVIG